MRALCVSQTCSILTLSIVIQNAPFKSLCEFYLVLIIDCLCFRSLIIFNPTEQLRTSVISVVVNCPDARVVDAETGRPVTVQISAVWVEPSKASAETFQVSLLNSDIQI